MVKINFQRYIICLYLESFVKLTFFEIVCELLVYLCLILCVANRDSESGTETTLGLVFRAFIENHVFLGKLNCLNLREILIT